MYTAAVIGELCEDILMHDPASVKVMGQEVWAKDIVVTAGGSVFFTGAALAKMGAKVDAFTTVGDDRMGRRMVKALGDSGINAAAVHTLKGQTTTASIVVCTGPVKDFVGCSPMLPLYLPTWEEVQHADLLYIAGYTIFPELWKEELFALLRKARAVGVKIAVDGQLLPVKTNCLAELCRLRELLPLVDIFFMARKEARAYFGTDDVDTCGQKLKALGFTGQAVCKQGENGCYILYGDKKVFVPSHPIEAYDTVGSGDIFGASYCHAQMQGWGVEKSARFAAVYTALSLGEYSDRKQFPPTAAVEKLLETPRGIGEEHE